MMRRDLNFVFLQNEVKDIKNENKELKSKISDLQDAVANMKTQRTGFIKFSQFWSAIAVL